MDAISRVRNTGYGTPQIKQDTNIDETRHAAAASYISSARQQAVLAENDRMYKDKLADGKINIPSFWAPKKEPHQKMTEQLRGKSPYGNSARNAKRSDRRGAKRGESRDGGADGNPYDSEFGQIFELYKGK